MNRRAAILSILAVGAAGFGGAAWYATRPAVVTEAEAAPRLSPEQAEALIRPYSPVLGPKDAPVTIVEFFDPACEACRAFYPIVEDIMSQHGDAVRVVLRYTPFHGESSEQAIRVLESARMQGVFVPVIEALLRGQAKWAARGVPDMDALLRIAASAGFDVEQGRSQMLFPGTTGVVNQDRADVETMGVQQTPTFFVNGRPLDPFGEAELRRLVAAEVAAAQG